MDRATAKKVAEAADRALTAAMKELGLEVTRGHTTFGDAEMSTKFTFSVVARKTEAKADESEMLGFDRNILGMTFVQGRTTYTITDIHMRKPKFPIIAKTANGKAFKFTPSAVARNLGGQVEFKRW